MSQPQIVIDPDETKRIEKNLILRNTVYIIARLGIIPILNPC